MPSYGLSLLKICVHSPVLTSHSQIVPSSPPLASVFPSGLKATDHTQLLCPCRVSRQWPVLVSQRRIVASWLPLAIRLPSGLKAMHRTQLLCPYRILTHPPVLASQRRIVASSPALAIMCPTGLKVTYQARSLCPSRVLMCSPVLTAQPSAKAPAIDPGDEAPFLVRGGEGSTGRAAMGCLTAAIQPARIGIDVLCVKTGEVHGQQAAATTEHAPKTEDADLSARTT